MLINLSELYNVIHNPVKLLKFNYKQIIERIIIILMPIEPETLQVLLKNSIALLPQFAATMKINYIVP